MYFLFILASMHCTKSHAEIQFTLHKGPIDIDSRQKLSALRVRLFYEYPYLYCGNQEEEQRVWEALSTDQTIWVVAYDQGKLVGAFVALPVNEHSHALITQHAEYRKGAALMLDEAIIDTYYQRQGIGRKLMQLLITEAVAQGYATMYFLTVVRTAHHPLKPKQFVDLDVVWSKLGGIPTNLTALYNWPTRCGTPENECIASVDNMVRYWYKTL